MFSFCEKKEKGIKIFDFYKKKYRKKFEQYILLHLLICNKKKHRRENYL